MNIENLEAFVFINHFGSINKASKALFLSQPSVSSRIKSLERELDSELFIRAGKQLILTDKGAQFLPFAESIVRTIKKGKDQLHDREGSRLVIGSSGLVSFYLIPRILPVLKERYPGLCVKVITDTSERVAERVAGGEVDVGFASNVSDPKLISTRVMESPIRLIVHPGHPFAGEDGVDVERLSEHPIVFFECGSLDWSTVHNLFLNLKGQPEIRYEVDSMESAKGFILNQAAIGFLPELSVFRELKNQQLSALDIPELANVYLKTDLIYRGDAVLPYLDDLINIAEETAVVHP